MYLIIKQACKTAQMSVPLATGRPAVWRWSKPFEFECEGDSGALQPAPPPSPPVSWCTEHTNLQASWATKLQGRNRHLKEHDAAQT